MLHKYFKLGDVPISDM